MKRHYVGSEARLRREGDERTGNNVALTPLWLLHRVREVLGTIDLDPATTPENPVGAARFIAPPDDGILAPWSGSVYCNPPYGRTISAWIEKALTEAQRGCRIVMLVPSKTGTRWWHAALESGDCLLLYGRLRFIGHENPATFSSALFGFNVSLASLSDIGTLVRAVEAA